MTDENKDSKPIQQYIDEATLIPVDLPQVVTKKNCKLCHSLHREEAEMLYEKNNHNVLRVHSFLTNDRQEDISYKAVSNHLKYHYSGPSENISLLEYAEDVSKWMSIQGDQSIAFLRAIAMLEREMTSLAAQNQGCKGDDKRKNIDTMKKLADTLLTYRKALIELSQGGETVTLIFNKLKTIVGDEIKESKDPEVRKVVGHILTRLKDEVGDIMVISK